MAIHSGMLAGRASPNNSPAIILEPSRSDRRLLTQKQHSVSWLELPAVVGLKTHKAGFHAACHIEYKGSLLEISTPVLSMPAPLFCLPIPCLLDLWGRRET